MPVSKANLALAKKYKAKVFKFKDLPLVAQLALIVYCDRLVEGMDHYEGKPVKDYLPKVLKKHGNARFGLATIPMEVLKQEVMTRNEDVREDWTGDWNAYHKWYIGHGRPAEHPKSSVWPPILSCFNDEVFQDGWHRFHRYAELGIKEIPVVYFP